MLEHHSQPNLHKIVSCGLEQVPGGDLDGGVPAREGGGRELKPAGLQHHPSHHRQRVPLQLQVINLLEAEVFYSNLLRRWWLKLKIVAFLWQNSTVGAFLD